MREMVGDLDHLFKIVGDKFSFLICFLASRAGPVLLISPGDGVPNYARIRPDHESRAFDAEEELNSLQILDHAFRGTPIKVVDQDIEMGSP